eukprot:69051_1
MAPCGFLVNMDTNTNTTVNETQEKDDDFKPRKIYDKAHIFWIITFIVNGYDYYTDIDVVTSWFKLSKHQCAGFGCSPIDQSYLKSLATALAIFSSVGFIAGIAIKIAGAHGLYQIYKHGQTKEAKQEKEEESTKLQVYIVWIPLLLEDCLSLWLIYAAMTGAKLEYVGDNRPVMIRSMVVSFISIWITLILECRSVNQLTDDARGTEDGYYVYEVRCGCCWCGTIGVLSVCAMFILVLTLIKTKIEPIVMLNDNQTQCRVYNEGSERGQYSADGNHLYNGSIFGEPVYVYQDCVGTEYEYKLRCMDDWNGNDVKLLHCQLYWEYSGSDLLNNNHCYRNGTHRCTFDIKLEHCGNYIIKCDDFDFHEGDPEMWACFDYCDV